LFVAVAVLILVLQLFLIYLFYFSFISINGVLISNNTNIKNTNKFGLMGCHCGIDGFVVKLCAIHLTAADKHEIHKESTVLFIELKAKVNFVFCCPLLTTSYS